MTDRMRRHDKIVLMMICSRLMSFALPAARDSSTIGQQEGP
jgi:hypothetical protein